MYFTILLHNIWIAIGRKGHLCNTFDFFIVWQQVWVDNLLPFHWINIALIMLMLLLNCVRCCEIILLPFLVALSWQFSSKEKWAIAETLPLWVLLILMELSSVKTIWQQKSWKYHNWVFILMRAPSVSKVFTDLATGWWAVQPPRQR